LFKIVTEESVGANLRRIEAVTSLAAYEYSAAQQGELEYAANLLKTPTKNVSAKVAALLDAQKKLKAELKSGAAAKGRAGIEEFLSSTIETNGYKLVIAQPREIKAATLRTLWDSLREAGIDATILLGKDTESGKAVFLAAGNDTATAAGFHAGNEVKEIAASLDGRGGGKPGMAQGGAEVASDDKLNSIIEALREAKAGA
jgi:alanyl-tRNA synthetase